MFVIQRPWSHVTVRSWAVFRRSLGQWAWVEAREVELQFKMHKHFSKLDKLTLLFWITHLMSRKIPLEAEVRKNAKISEGFYIPNGDKQDVPEEAHHYILKHVNKWC